VPPRSEAGGETASMVRATVGRGIPARAVPAIKNSRGSGRKALPRAAGRFPSWAAAQPHAVGLATLSRLPSRVGDGYIGLGFRALVGGRCWARVALIAAAARRRRPHWVWRSARWVSPFAKMRTALARLRIPPHRDIGATATVGSTSSKCGTRVTFRGFTTC
jgi:hypothetical protein